MSEDLRGEAWQHLQKADSQRQRGQYSDALVTLTKAEKLARKAKAPDILSAVLGITASVLQSKGMFDESLEMNTAALNIQEELAKMDPFFITWIAGTLNNLGALLDNMGRGDDAKKRCERALEIHEALLATDPQSSVYQSLVATTLNNLGAILGNMGRPDDAKKRCERALEIHEALLATDPQSSVYQSDVATTLDNLGAMLNNMDCQDDAKKRYERALEIREALLATDPQHSVYQSNVATTLNNFSDLLNHMGRQDDAKKRYERALEIREALLATDPQSSVYQLDLSMTLHNLGTILAKMDRPDDAKKRYERALEIHEALLATYPQSSVYQSEVATTLNNLGNILANTGRADDAKKRYERALEIYKALLATDPQRSVYQSNVATTFNNLGSLLSDMGNKKGALSCYQESLGIYTEPIQYLTTKAKVVTIINIIELVSECAQKDTNIINKSKYFKKIYELYKKHDPFFSRYGLVHERGLVKEAGLSAHIQYLMLNARSEEDKEKRIEKYETCIGEVEQIAESEDDENLKELWSSIMYYLNGRQFVNRAMQSEPPDTGLMKKAIEQFKSAKDRYSQANVCYCIYTVLLELESIEVLDDEAVSRLKGLLKHAIKSLPEKMDNTVKSAFHEIEVLLNDRNLKTSPEMFERLNRCITKIDYYALREHFNHISCKIRTYLEEPFNPEVDYSNWALHVTFDEPEKVQGKLTIKAGDRVVFDKPIGKRNLINPEHRSETKDETITFITKKGRNVTREVTYSEEIMYDGGHLDVHFLQHDCKRGITGAMLNIAIVQLKYHLNKAGSVLIIEDNDAYSAKITQILEAVKGKADLIVFPEFSIPVRYLPEMKQYSDETGIVIVAGSHYITDENLVEHDGMFHDKFGDNDLRKNISPVIIPSSDQMFHTEKILPAKEERELFNEEGMTNGSLNRIFKLNDNVTFGIMICFDFLNDDLRKRITDACDVILVPQTNPGTKRFHKTGYIEIDNPRGAGNKAYIMASGIFTYDGRKDMMGGDSGVILTLDKDSAMKGQDAIIETIKVEGNKVYEQFIQIAQLNMKFNPARDTQIGQVPITYKLIHIFEENEMLESAENDKKDDRNPQAFPELLKTIYSCNDRHELKRILADNGELIRKHSPLMHKNTRDLENLKTDEIKERCTSIVLN